jgi:hypothetical protein
VSLNESLLHFLLFVVSHSFLPLSAIVAEAWGLGVRSPVDKRGHTPLANGTKAFIHKPSTEVKRN